MDCVFVTEYNRCSKNTTLLDYSRYRQNSAINAGIGSDMGIVSILRMLINWEKTKNIHFVFHICKDPLKMTRQKKTHSKYYNILIEI